MEQVINSPISHANKQALLNGSVMSLNNSIGTIEDFARDLLVSPPQPNETSIH